MQNVLIQKREGTYLTIPVGTATEIVQDICKLKGIALLYELKPLYPSGNIKARNNKKHLLYQDIAEYIGISQSSIIRRLAYLKKHKLIWYDKNNALHLAGKNKIREFIQAGHKIKRHKIKNQNINYEANKKYQYCSTEYIIRTLAITESIKKQEHSLKLKLFAYELYHVHGYDKWFKGGIQHNMQESNKMAWLRFLQLVTHKLKTKTKFKKLWRVLMKNYTQYIDKHVMRHHFHIINAEKGHADIVPDCTLSCSGLSALYNLNSISMGFYWQSKLLQLDLLEIIHKRHRFIPNTSPLTHVHNFNMLAGINDGIFSFKDKKTGQRKYFYTLPNLLTPML